MRRITSLAFTVVLLNVLAVSLSYGWDQLVNEGLACNEASPFESYCIYHDRPVVTIANAMTSTGEDYTCGLVGGLPPTYDYFLLTGTDFTDIAEFVDFFSSARPGKNDIFVYQGHGGIRDPAFK